MKIYETRTIILSLEDIEEALLDAFSASEGFIAFELEDVSEEDERYPRMELAGARIVINTQE